MSNNKQTFHKCEDRLPTYSGEYRIKNNSECNNGEGLVRFDIETGWDIPDVIRPFYRVVGWYETQTVGEA
jgi:hypothetical protein